TVYGCMLGGYTGSASLQFSGGPSGWLDTVWPATCGPAGSTWWNDHIIVEVPNKDTVDTSDDAISGPLRVTNQFNEMDVSNDATGPAVPDFTLVSTPTPNLCSLTPNFGTQSSLNATTATGEGFGTSGTVHFYNDALGRSSATFSTWAESLIQGIDIPADALTGVGVNGVMVNAGGGDSNPVNFYITCSNDAQCTTGCCSAGQCADAAVCSGGGPAAPCQLPAHPNCSSGPISPPGGYECISDTGELPMTIPIGDDCRFCCRPPSAHNGLTCSANQGNCSGADRGLYCGCVTDGQCGSSTTVGCGDFGGEMCCTGRPSVVSVNPFDGEGDVCMNRAVVVEFDQIMDTGTFNNLTEFEVVSDATPLVPYPGVITSYVNTGHTFLVFTPDVPWAANEPHTVTVSGDPDINDGVHLGVLNQNQVGLNGDFVSHFTADDILCNLDHVEIDVAYNPGPTTVLNASQDMYVCTRDDCPADLTGGIAGNQHGYVATAVDADLNPLTTGASYDWSNSTTNGVLNVETPGNNWTYISTLGPDGTELIRADVDLGAAGSGSATVFARVEACDNPWPNSAPYFYPDGLGILEPMNFTTYYCRDGGLPGMVNPLVYISPGASTPDNDLLREVFFSLDDTSGDVIGIRVMENESFLSPSAWFSQMFPTDTGACNPIGTVDGYQACRAGRTIYVAATNLAGGTLYPNIYLISYNDGANGQTVNIYNQLVENWFFNSDPPSLMSPCATSLLETNKACIVRDTKRVTELGEIGYLLLNYQYNNGIFPELSAGTFLSGFTTSKWPSWVAEFGNEIGISPPVDPINEFEPLCLPIPPWDPAGTCWNDDDHRFLCPAGSHVYAYSGASSNAFLFARLEYTGTGSWTNFSSDPCGGLPGSQQCQCFNYWAPSTDNFWITNWSPPI
ncbi:Ig-like domain-containing protein, partial [Patescibacteria group bacterium]|nr:Ig-like domain-containing protein [Patescibacteria group bacterium]